MRNKNLAMLVVPRLAALAAQAAMASERHRTRTKGGTVAIEQSRNSKCLCRTGQHCSAAGPVDLGRKRDDLGARWVLICELSEKGVVRQVPLLALPRSSR
jgi:hypothetical protein